MRTPYLKLTFSGCSLELYYLGIVFILPSSLLTSVVANKQGGSGGESVNGTDRTSGSIINNLLFSGGD
jgi:hypothetical protein